MALFSRNRRSNHDYNYADNGIIPISNIKQKEKAKMKEVSVKVPMYKSVYAEVWDTGDVVTKYAKTPEKLTNKNVSSVIESIEGVSTGITCRKVITSVRTIESVRLSIQGRISNNDFDEDEKGDKVEVPEKVSDLTCDGFRD